MVGSVEDPQLPLAIAYLGQVYKACPSASSYGWHWAHRHALLRSPVGAAMLAAVETIDALVLKGGPDVLSSECLEDVCKEAYELERTQRDPRLSLSGHSPQLRGPTRVAPVEKEVIRSMKQEQKLSRLTEQLSRRRQHTLQD